MAIRSKNVTTEELVKAKPVKKESALSYAFLDGRALYRSVEALLEDTSIAALAEGHCEIDVYEFVGTKKLKIVLE